jgi:hypothetical protein
MTPRTPEQMTADQLVDFISWLRRQATQHEMVIARFHRDGADSSAAERKARRDLRNYRGATIKCERLLKEKQQAANA